MSSEYLNLLANIADISGWLTLAAFSLYWAVSSWLERKRRRKEVNDILKRFSKDSEYHENLDVLLSGGGDVTVTEAPSTKDPRDPRVMQIFWGTNRSVDRSSESFFGGERDHQLHLGVAAVRIPENHRIGRVEQPFELTVLSYRMWRQTRRSDQHFVLTGIQRCDEEEWHSLIKETDQTEAFVFVHGFNTSFSEALFRCAQIAWDTKLDAIPFLFSWPSRGNVLDYLYDRESAMGARGYFLEFLETICSDTQVKTVHILAHSMGNQVVLEALAHHSHSEKPLLISEILMAAPDVDADVYRTLTPKVSPAVRGMTLYASSVDRALAASRTLAGDMFRAGDVSTDGPTVVPGVDAIDVTGLGADLLGLNHGVFAQARSILNDVSIVVASGHRPPHKRLADIRCVPEGYSTPKYWRYAD